MRTLVAQALALAGIAGEGVAGQPSAAEEAVARRCWAENRTVVVGGLGDTSRGLLSDDERGRIFRHFRKYQRSGESEAVTMYRLLINATAVLRLADLAIIPNDDKNRDWLDYLAWCADGHAAEPAEVPAPTQDELDAAAAREYAKLVALRGMSPAQVVAWVTANVTNLTQAQDAIATLAVGMSVLSRRI